MGNDTQLEVCQYCPQQTSSTRSQSQLDLIPWWPLPVIRYPAQLEHKTTHAQMHWAISQTKLMACSVTTGLSQGILSAALINRTHLIPVILVTISPVLTPISTGILMTGWAWLRLFLGGEFAFPRHWRLPGWFRNLWNRVHVSLEFLACFIFGPNVGFLRFC